MMEELLARYVRRLAAAGLVESDGALLAGLDAELSWSAPENAPDPRRPILRAALESLGASALLLARPSGAHQTILAALARRALAEAAPGTPAAVTPGDCETRTFLHDIPALRGLSAANVVAGLSGRAGCLLLDADGAAYVAAAGSISPEQTFVTASSVCFAGFTAYFAGYLRELRLGRTNDAKRAEFARIRNLLAPERPDAPELAAGPFTAESAVRAALVAAGRAVVERRLVDSYFGNISYRLRTADDDVIFISQTGSSLDELEACIDPCRMDGKSCAALTASSEFAAHRAIYAGGPARAILHGHPRFSVILSLDCDRPDCPNRGQCHRSCDVSRGIVLPDGAWIPIIPGEVGNGPFGLCRTLPPALLMDGGRRAAIVYGHGTFAPGARDFRDAFASLVDVERACREEYFRRVALLGG